jgi:hypothetical protein
MQKRIPNPMDKQILTTAKNATAMLSISHLNFNECRENTSYNFLEVFHVYEMLLIG